MISAREREGEASNGYPPTDPFPVIAKGNRLITVSISFNEHLHPMIYGIAPIEPHGAQYMER
jgi:hypothetical protein